MDADRLDKITMMRGQLSDLYLSLDRLYFTGSDEWPVVVQQYIFDALMSLHQARAGMAIHAEQIEQESP